MAQQNTFDYIIVGGGTAGVVIASRLSQYLPGVSIALLEHGPDEVDNPAVNEPSSFIKFPIKFMCDYSTTPQEHLNGRKILNMAGRLLSGSSAVNVGAWMRGSSTDHDLFAQKVGHERFRFENMLPYFKRTETYWDGKCSTEFHGFEGPVHTIGGRKYPLREDVKQTYEKLGYNYNPDPMAGNPIGLSGLTQSYVALSPSTSARQHSARVYDLAHVKVYCGSVAARVLFDSSKRATGVELINGAQLMAWKEVIISCGTQRSPQLLKLSGIGPEEELSMHQIPVLVDLPQVGKNLFDHCSLTLYFKLKHPDQGLALPFAGTAQPSYGQGVASDWFGIANIAPDNLAPYLQSDNEPGVQDTTHPHLQPKRCHILAMPHYFPVVGTDSYNPEVANPTAGTHISISSVSMLPISRGTVTLKSADPADEPVIDPKYMSTHTDLFMLRYAVRQTLSLTSTTPFSDHLTGETPPADPAFPALTPESSDEEIDHRIRGFMETIVHPMGTCALGTVLDDEFRVKGVKGLRVCDASVFPEPLSAMPQATVYAFGEMCAELVAGRE